jgi:transcriptional regulator with XRE-family HTH domain
MAAKKITIRRKIDGHVFTVDVPAVEHVPGEVGVELEMARAAEVAIACAVGAGAPSAAGLRYIRGALGLSGVRLAQLLDVRPETLSRWESGASNFDRTTWLAVGALARERAGIPLRTVESSLDALAQGFDNPKEVCVPFFIGDLLLLQQELAPQLSPCKPYVDSRGHFWTIGKCGDVVVEVVDPSFTDPTWGAGTSAVSYVADRGKTIIVVDPANQSAVTTFPVRLAEAAKERTAVVAA